MMSIQVDSRQLDVMSRRIFEMPNKVTKSMRKGLNTFSRDLKRELQLKAPRWKGYLSNSISVRKQGDDQWIVKLQAPYAGLQDQGYAPHFVLTKRSTRSGYQISDWLEEKYGITNVGLIFVRQYTPFVEPAFAAMAKQLNMRIPKILDEGMLELTQPMGAYGAEFKGYAGRV